MRSDRGGAPREGAALLQGLVVCGRCGRSTHSSYSASRSSSRRYYCVVRIGQFDYQPECQGMGGRQVDEAMLAEVCNILKPAALAATAQALTHADEQEDVRLAAFETAAQRTRYAAERAWRQFDACEPSTDWSPKLWKPSGRRPWPKLRPRRPNSIGNADAVPTR